MSGKQQVNSSILRDSSLDKQFKQDGFLRLPLFQQGQIDALRLLYESTRLAHETVAKTNPFHSTQDTFDSELIRHVDQEAKRILMPTVSAHFEYYKVLTANFLVKEIGPNSVLHPHQDWNFVDENEFFSFNIWIPLESTERSNGCLRFLAGSHKIVPTIRANDNYVWAFQSIKDYLNELLVDVPTKEGECVLLNHSVIHGSWPNMGTQPRVALVLGMCPAEAPLRHFVSKDGKTVQEFGITPELIVNLRKGENPEGAPLLNSYAFEFPSVSIESFQKWMTERSST